MALPAELYVYGLQCPVTELIRYVGVSSRPERRLREHLSFMGRYCNHRIYPWFKSLRDIGVKPKLILLSDAMPKRDALRLERQWHVFLHRNFPGQCVNGVSGREFQHLSASYHVPGKQLFA